MLTKLLSWLINRVFDGTFVAADNIYVFLYSDNACETLLNWC